MAKRGTGGGVAVNMIPPLVPSDVDLRGYEFMPLYGHHLFGSEFDGKVNDTAWRVAVTLWWKAWNQVPAASLPNDDTALAKFADFGRDVKAFRKVREQALYGFVLCDDGRLYHRKLSVWALEAWDRRVKERARKAKWRDGKTRDGDVPETGTSTRTHVGQTTGHDDGQRWDVPAEGKRSEAKVSELQKREVGVTPPTMAVDNSASQVKSALENIEGQPRYSNPGQQWDSPTWVNATATTVGKTQLPGEPFADFRDRVYGALQARIGEAKRVTA